MKGFFVATIVMSGLLLLQCEHSLENEPIITEHDREKYELAVVRNWAFGYEYFRNDEYRKALNYFWFVAEKDTARRFDRIFCFLGECYLAIEKPDSALIVYERGVSVFSDDSCYCKRHEELLLALNISLDEEKCNTD